jgi:hypothetical protein
MTGPLPEPVRRASCACGQIELHASGEPRRVGLCHCLDCRKLHGAPVSAFVIFSRASVVLSGPERGPLPHAALGTFQSRPGYRRVFCTRCGAHVFWVIERSDEIELLLGSFDETNVFTPTYETWTIRRERWLGDLPTVTRHFERDRADGATT